MIRVHALGGLSVRGEDGQPLTGAAAQPRRMAVLALLARAGHRGLAREKLLSLLWPDADEERGPAALTQALYMLRRDLGSDDSIAGVKELRLDSAHATSDVAEFASAVARGDDEAAARLYEGTFLDGFHLAGSDEFSRWVDRERALLANDYARVLESLARTAGAKGEMATAVGWWRRLAGLDPLNARITVGLMEALAKSGDRAGALQHARVYEALLAQELDIAPDHDVLGLAAKLRSRAEEPPVSPAVRQDSAADAPADIPTTATSTDQPPEVRPVESLQRAKPRQKRLRNSMVAGAVLASLSIVALAMTWRVGSKPRGATGRPTIVIGRMVDYDKSGAGGAGRVLADMIGTNLSRSPGMRVISTARIYELLRELGSGAQDTSAGMMMAAARRAGGTELIDGAVYALAGGGLRIDLRRIDIASGAVLRADRIDAADAFALADSVALRVVKQFGVTAPRGSVADVTTRSAVAYQLYTDGVQEYFAGEREKSAGHFADALAEDSTFAMAAYYRSLSSNSDGAVEYLARAFRLSSRVSERERLIIRAQWALTIKSPSFRAFAESLATRYPDEVDGYLFLGESLVEEGEFLAAIPWLNRVVDMDSLSLRGANTDCLACKAMTQIVSAYIHSDSLDAAERISLAWLLRQSRSVVAQRALADVLEYAGRIDEARVAFAKLATLERVNNGDVIVDEDVELRVRSLDFSLDRRLAERARAGQGNGLFWLVISLRAQGRFKEALEVANRLRAGAGASPLAPGAAPYDAFAAAQVMFELGQFRASAALFDSVAHGFAGSFEASAVARLRAWFLTHAADARAAAGDTAGFTALADSVEAMGAQSVSGRDQLLHHYVRALLLKARGRNPEAANEFRRSIFSPTQGFTRANVELARALLAMGRAREAVEILRPALHAPLDGANFYVTHAELHEMLAHAWDLAGNADSAAAHHSYVARAWVNADAGYLSRARRKTE